MPFMKYQLKKSGRSAEKKCWKMLEPGKNHLKWCCWYYLPPNVPVNLSWQPILDVFLLQYSLSNEVWSLQKHCWITVGFSVCLLLDMGQKHFRMCESVNRPHWICFVPSIWWECYSDWFKWFHSQVYLSHLLLLIIPVIYIAVIGLYSIFQTDWWWK